MKKNILFTLLLSGVFLLTVLRPATAQQHCGGTIVLESQEEVNNFALQGCSSVDNLTISGGGIYDLSPLSGLTKASTITIRENWNLRSLSGLEGLKSVGHISIDANADLTSLTGLDNLTSVESLYICCNERLTSLTGLEGLKSAGHISIVYSYYYGSDYYGLTSLTGLDNLTSVEELNIGYNAGLTSLKGLGNLSYIGSLDVYDNPNLRSLYGLGSVVKNRASIYGNPNMFFCCSLAFLNPDIWIAYSNGDGCQSKNQILFRCLTDGDPFSDFTPKSGGPGTRVELSGGGFTYLKTVQFGQKKVIFNVLNDSTAIAVTPPGLSGPVRIFLDYGEDQIASDTSFTATGPTVEPSRPASLLRAVRTTDSTATLSWKNGDGLRHFVVLKEAEQPQDFLPQDGLSYPTSTRLLQQDATSGNYLIYRNDHNFIRISGLSPNTTYQASVYEYNTDNRGGTDYLLDGAPSVTFRTPPASASARLLLSENPMEETTTVSLHGIPEAEGATLIVSDLMNNSIREHSFEGKSLTLHRGELKPGIYLLRAMVNGKTLTIKRMVVE